MSSLTSDTSARTERRWVALIVLAALLLRIGLVSMPRVIRWDEPDYLRLGFNLWTGAGYTVSGAPELHYTPLYPILAGAVYALTDNPELGSAVWYVLLGSLTVIPVYALARRIYGRGIARMSALFVAVFPALSATVLYWGTFTEPLYILIVCSVLWTALVALEDDKRWAWAACGALMGLGYLARPEGVVWLASLLALMVLVQLCRRRLLRGATLGRLGLYLAAFLIVASPYMLYLYRTTGAPMATGKLSITYDIGEAVLDRDPVQYDKVTASLDQTGEILWWSDERFERSALDLVTEDPAKLVNRTWRNLQRLASDIMAPTLFPLFFGIPIVLGWLGAPWNRRRLLQEALLWAGALPVLSFLPFHIEIRFFSPAFPMLLIWIAAGLWRMGAWVAETVRNYRAGESEALIPAQGSAAVPGSERVQRIVTLALLVLVLGYWGWMHTKVVAQGRGDLDYAHKAAGLWLRESAPAEAVVMSRDLAISLYAERGFVPSPRAEYAAYLDYARRKGVTHLVVDEHELRVLRPFLGALLNDANPPPELEGVYTASDQRGRTIVYRIKGQ
ncbi:MAG: glycosyltransferase family 39 protein [Chloroflexi bacterium]|nr:glycosyltransferase family 39 protein [Chloroflexota bacterium]